MQALMFLMVISLMSTMASIMLFRVHPFTVANLIIFLILFLIPCLKMKKRESDEKEIKEEY